MNASNLKHFSYQRVQFSPKTNLQRAQLGETKLCSIELFTVKNEILEGI